MFDRRVPDLRQGVFETLLVVDGLPVELDAHLSRLRASLATLYPNLPQPPLDVPSLMHPYGRPSGDTSGPSAIRVTVAPDENETLTATVELRVARVATEVALASLPLPGGLGPHKWADRSLLEKAQADRPADALPLILDLDGAVLEASRANLFAVFDGTLFTPPLDGRILPGITRARVLDLAAAQGVETREAELGHADLLGAEEVFLTGSVRGVEPAASLDGAPLAGAGPLAAQLTADLRRAWLGAPVP